MYFTEAALLRCLVDAASTLIKTLILLDIIFSYFASIIVTYFKRFGLPKDLELSKIMSSCACLLLMWATPNNSPCPYRIMP
jgi:hypothetical protein